MNFVKVLILCIEHIGVKKKKKILILAVLVIMTEHFKGKSKRKHFLVIKF